MHGIHKRYTCRDQYPQLTHSPITFPPIHTHLLYTYSPISLTHTYPYPPAVYLLPHIPNTHIHHIEKKKGLHAKIYSWASTLQGVATFSMPANRESGNERDQNSLVRTPGHVQIPPHDSGVHLYGWLCSYANPTELSISYYMGSSATCQIIAW